MAQDLRLTTATDLQQDHGDFQWDDTRQWIAAMLFMAAGLHHMHTCIRAYAAQQKPPPLLFGAEELKEAYAIIRWCKVHQSLRTRFQLLQLEQNSSMYSPWASHNNHAGVKGHTEALQPDPTIAPLQPL
jgi:hypothetical protein